MRSALVLGGASCVFDDLARLEEVIGGRWPGLVLAVNDMGYTWERRLDHWCTLHAKKMAPWRKKRLKLLGRLGRSPLWDCHVTWSCSKRTVVDQHFNGWKNGSSGLYAVSVALQRLGCDRVVCCGVPMDAQPNRFRNEDAWKQYRRYLRGWEKHHDELGAVRSMSGWTRERLGAPNPAWLTTVTELA